MFSYSTLKEYLFRLDPETAHWLAGLALGAVDKITPLQNAMIERNFCMEERLTQTIFGRSVYNPVGLAAGFDKNAQMIRSLVALGFGFVEVGTVTPKPQDGNPRPRLWRFEQQESLQNAMGFNNDGMDKVVKRLQKIFPFSTPIGVNIGKNRLTAEKLAISDYKQLIENFKDLCDYLVINISSPNTKGLRDLQNETFLAELFDTAKQITTKPVLLKLSPDLEKKEAVKLAVCAVEHGAGGIIATNTTTDYSLLPEAKTVGGISGRVLQDRSFEMFEALSRELFGKTLLISVGGIDCGQEAYRRIKAGASLVQIYTSLIYKGPALVKQINEEIMELMNFDGFAHISEAIGADRKI